MHILSALHVAIRCAYHAFIGVLIYPALGVHVLVTDLSAQEIARRLAVPTDGTYLCDLEDDLAEQAGMGILKREGLE
jgi:hypothetical protein